jgi:hypothetical protein
VLQQDPPLFIEQRIAFTRVSKETEPVCACVQQVVDKPRLTVQVNRPVLIKSRIQYREYALDRCHSFNNLKQQVSVFHPDPAVSIADCLNQL